MLCADICRLTFRKTSQYWKLYRQCHMLGLMTVWLSLAATA